jgi:hypothetical protein
MSNDDIPDIADAIEQIAEFFGFKAHHQFTVNGEQYCITYRQFLPVDVERKLQEADKSLEDCDRVMVDLPDGKKVKGSGYLLPLRRKGELLADSRDALRLIAMWGEEKYRRFEAAGGPPEILTAIWAKQEAEYEKWRRAGSKSTDSN